MDENKPREPTDAELRAIKETYMEDTGLDEEEAEHISYAFIAVFDHYITDCPGYAGKLASVVFGGAPEFVETYIWRDGKCTRLRPEVG